MNDRVYQVAAASFEAARQVPIAAEGHRSRRLHGHGFLARLRAQLPEDWSVRPSVEGPGLPETFARCVARLDYRNLNELVAVPTDENLARWLRDSLDQPGIESIGIQSTRHQGADLDRADHVHVWRRFRFEAAHRLPQVPAGHPCGRMHGHGFEVILHADQDLGGADLGIDFDQLEALWAPLHAQLHYACLNDLPGLENPTSEMLSAWVWRRLKPRLPALSWVTVYETTTAGCHYDGHRYRIWKEQHCEGALRLLRAPEGDPRRRLHGHTYLLRLHLTAPLDDVMGWTLDYGDVKERFRPVYRQLDHQLLNDLPGLADPDPARLTLWIRDAVGGSLPQLDRIDVHETPGCGAVLSWGDLGPALPT